MSGNGEERKSQSGVLTMSVSDEPITSFHQHRWGIILAGGDGTRLRPLTRLACGDNRPKQFCPLLGGKTLLARTRSRIAQSIDQSRMLFVLTKKHEPFYSKELEMVPAHQKVIQSMNRGTLPAILWSLLRVSRLDNQAVVTFFPSDHHFADERKFMAAVEWAFSYAEVHTESVILLGASPERAETEYGWIEPESPMGHEIGGRIDRVKRFWEKPARPIAQQLLADGCLWNTFVMVGTVGAFLGMIRRTSSTIFQTLGSTLADCSLDAEEEQMRYIYDRLTPTDFSKQVLSVSTEGLAVANCGEVGWSDLGDPRRLVTALTESGIESPWAGTQVCGVCGLEPEQVAMLPPSNETREVVSEMSALHSSPAERNPVIPQLTPRLSHVPAE